MKNRIMISALDFFFRGLDFLAKSPSRHPMDDDKVPESVRFSPILLPF